MSNPWSTSSLLATSLPPHCEPTTPFLTQFSLYFHTCVPTPLAFISTTLGTLSIVSWLFAQLPQIYKNYQLQSTAGLSILFLLEWCLGDATNLLGAIFTRQAAWQIIVAGYYVLVDVCLVTQYFWYMHYKAWRSDNSSFSSLSDDSNDGGSDFIEGMSPTAGTFLRRTSIGSREEVRDVKDSRKVGAKPIQAARPEHILYPNEKATPSPSNPHVMRVGSSSYSPVPSPRSLLFVSMLCAVLANASPITVPSSPSIQPSSALESRTEFAGRILSWISTILYLGSRLPQLYKNHVRRSTAGLSPLLFIAAFCGNLFYSTSLLTNPNAWNDFPPYGGHGWTGKDGNKRWEWVGLAAPFWLGAAGVLALDGAVGVQFVLFGEMKEEKIVKIKDSRGRTHWERVSGWMRGWVPSVSRERKVPVEEGEALIRSIHEDYGSV